MGDVRIHFDDNMRDTAVQLIAAARELDRPDSDVRTEMGAFVVDEKIADKAGFGKPAAKKAAKKASSKKAPAKKASAKNTQE